jgi:hypothetical protein
MTSYTVTRRYIVNQENDEVRELAEERVEAQLGFRNHLRIYLIMNAIFFLIWLIVFLFNRDAWYPWFLFPLIIWGIGIYFHGRSVYRMDEEKQHKEALIEREMERIKREEGISGGEEEPQKSDVEEST